MVHTMQDGISPRRQERRALASVREKVEELLPKLVHCEHFMCCIAMQIKRLGEQRKVVMCNEENKYGHKAGVLNIRGARSSGLFAKVYTVDFSSDFEYKPTARASQGQ